MFGPLCNQTVHLKTDSNTLYYSIMKLRSSPSILKHNKGLKKYAFLNNSRNNCHRNYTNRPDISTNAHVQINRSILAPYGTHAMIWGFLCIMDAGRRVNKITAVVLTIYMGKLPVGGGGDSPYEMGVRADMTIESHNQHTKHTIGHSCFISSSLLKLKTLFFFNGASVVMSIAS